MPSVVVAAIAAAAIVVFVVVDVVDVVTAAAVVVLVVDEGAVVPDMVEVADIPPAFGTTAVADNCSVTVISDVIVLSANGCSGGNSGVIVETSDTADSTSSSSIPAKDGEEPFSPGLGSHHEPPSLSSCHGSHHHMPLVASDTAESTLSSVVTSSSSMPSKDGHEYGAVSLISLCRGSQPQDTGQGRP